MDLMAYHQITAQRGDPLRFALLKPASLDDLVTVELVKRGKLKTHVPDPLTDPIKIASSRMVASGQDASAVAWLMKEE